MAEHNTGEVVTNVNAFMQQTLDEGGKLLLTVKRNGKNLLEILPLVKVNFRVNEPGVKDFEQLDAIA